MKAAMYKKYGPPEVLKIKDVEKPSPNRNEVLVRVYATTVNRTDCGYRSAKYIVSRLFTGLTKPKRPIGGSEFAGKIVEIGVNASEFIVGDKVFGFEDVRGGAHAEYMVQRADGSIAKMPSGFSYEEMAPAGEGATYALNVLKAVGIKKNQNVLVYGASGAIGSAAVQILKHQGARVTAVCGTKNVKLVKSLGADEVIDYQKQDFTKTDDRFVFVFDAVGKSSYGVCRKLLTPKGQYYSTELGKGGQNIFLSLWFSLTGSRKVLFPIPKINKEMIEHIKSLVESGAYKPVVDKIYPLDDIVQATKYVETEQKTGNVVIRVK